MVTLTEAIAPTARDLTEVRVTVLGHLESEDSVATGELLAAVLDAVGLPRDSVGKGISTTEQSSTHPIQDVDPMDPPIRARRLRHALDEILHGLYLEGVITPAAGDGSSPGTGSVPVSGPSWRGGRPYEDHHVPAPPYSRWRSTGGPGSARAQLVRAELPDTYRELLGPRGAEVLGEGLRAFRKGLFIAGVDLLGAASEAAWFGLASEVTGDAVLERLVASGDNAGQVIERTAAAILQGKAWSKPGLRALQARAGHLRDLRNYGLHPTGERDEALEQAFTEHGCALLYLATPSYLGDLGQIRQRLRVQD